MDSSGSISQAVGKQSRTRYQIVMILMVTLFIAYIDRVNISVLIVDKGFLAAMGIANDPVSKGMLMTVFLICYGLGNVIFSPIGDWLGPRKAMTLSIVLWAVSCIIGGVAGSFLAMIIARAILGFGESLHWPMQSKFVKNWFPCQERGTANAVWVTGLALAPMFAMPAFTWLIPAIGWRGSFFVLASLSSIPLIAIWFFTADHPREYRKISSAERDYIEDALKKEDEAEGGLCQASIWENMKSFMGDYRFWLVVILYGGVTSIWWGTMAWLPSYLKEARGFNWKAMGALSALPYALYFFMNFISAHFSDRMGRRAPFAMLGMVGSTVFIYLSSQVESNMAAAVLISCGIACIGIAMPCSWALLQQIVPSKACGAGAGMMNGITNGISGLAPILIGFLIAKTGSYTSGLMYLVAWGALSATSCAVLSYKKL